MPSGGHARSGPAPDPRSARSEKRSDGWTDLPAKYAGRIPKFPLEAKSTAEDALWKVVWRKPQAAMWARQGLVWQVAAYVRSFLESTEAGAPASLKTAVLRQEDTLGISTVGLNALRWRIPADEVGVARAAQVVPAEPAAAPVRRLRSTA
jgi:hypothetical protein